MRHGASSCAALRRRNHSVLTRRLRLQIPTALVPDGHKHIAGDDESTTIIESVAAVFRAGRFKRVYGICFLSDYSTMQAVICILDDPTVEVMLVSKW